MIYVRSHNFSTQSGKILCPGAIPIPSEHTRSETTMRVVKDCPDQTTALRTGCSYDCDNFSAAHCDFPPCTRRLHRGYVSKRCDYSVSKRCVLHAGMPWILRC